MKINKAKLLVGTLAIVATAATVGSISGTVAWFQYSTRSTVSYTGASAHCSENLQIRIRHSTDEKYPWQSDLTASDISKYLTNATTDTTPGIGRSNATNLRPVTTGQFDVSTTKVPDLADLHKSPIYQIWSTSNWQAATNEDYVVIPLELRVLDVNGKTSAETLARKIYISNITLQAASDNPSGKEDISSALRVGISAGNLTSSVTTLTKYTTFSKSGGAVNVAGKLDLNKDGYADKDGNYDWDTRNEQFYGDYDTANSKPFTATSTGLTAVSSADAVGIVNDENPYSITGKEIGSVATDNTLAVDILLYLEGWQELGSYKANVGGSANVDMKTIWDAATFVDAKFNFGIRFTSEVHPDGHA